MKFYWVSDFFCKNNNNKSKQQLLLRLYCNNHNIYTLRLIE